jgi:tetratricopeptide (TPR) repeat protein/DNA-binding PadR family transcriptional regulator
MGIEQVKVEDRILLHLHSYIKFADDYEVPKAMSQRGIGESVWIAWSNVPRAMKRLVEQELVLERTARVKGEFRKKKVYILSPKGFARAKELKEELGGKRVEVLRDGARSEMAFSEAVESASSKAPYLELLRGIDDSGVLDLDRAAARWAQKVEMVDRMERAPRPRAFLGREEELAALRAMLDANRIVVLHGIAGIGKTSLAVRLLEDLRKQTNVLWVTLHNWDTMPGVLAAVASFLAETGRRATQDHLSQHPTPELGEVVDALYTDLEDLKGVLVFDDFHKASEGVTDLFGVLLEVLRDRPSPSLLLVSRHVPSFYDRRWVVINRVVGELHLDGLDRASARRLLEGRAMTEDEFERAYSTTRGHPLALELLRDARATAPLKDVMAFVREQVFEGLTEGERSTLVALSVHRGGVPREIALAAAGRGGGAEALDRLQGRGLVRDVGGNQVDIHDLVREFFYARLAPEERVTLHRAAAEAWAHRKGPDAAVERAHHLALAGEAERAVGELDVLGETVMGDPRVLREMLAIVEAASSAGALPVSLAGRADLLRGDALAALDQADDATEVYTRLLDGAIAAGDRAGEGRILHRLGLLNSRRGQRDQAIELQRRARKAFEASDDAAGAARCRLAIAEVLGARERTGEAVKELRGALAAFESVGDARGVATACTRLGSMYLDLERPEEARAFLERALGGLEPHEEASQVALANYLLGEAHRLEETWDEAAKAYERALELFQRAGDKRMAANACNSLGDTYMAMGDEVRAGLFHQRALDLMVAQ